MHTIRILVTRQGQPPMELDYDQPAITMGRAAECDLQLPSNNVSKHHATLKVQGGVVTLVDERSTNGTYVEAERVTEPRVVTGADEIHIGEFTIVARALAEPGPTQVIDVQHPAAAAKPSAPRGPQVRVNPYDWSKK